MGLINLRELVSFPPGSAGNDSETIINGVPFNLTALKHWNYTYYDNGTISNSSSCYIIFGTYKPTFLSNGSWVNSTTCYVPIYRIKTRGITGIAFAAIFAISIMFTLINLKKHGQLFLREDKRFRAVGRRWQWYWALFVAACGMISCITGVDVDRNYLQGTPIILQSFFFVLMLPGTLAMVWEAVRHWGSWQERQICDRDPYSLPQDDRRGQAEFYMPLVFYFFDWLYFFMTIPRSWTRLQMQRSGEQEVLIAKPAGTDARFKVGGIIAALTFFIIIYNLSHSLYYYKPRLPPGSRLTAKLHNFRRYCPSKLFLLILVLGIRVAYSIASSWQWDLSIFKHDVHPGWPYGLGYGTTVLLLLIMEVFGFRDENEDRILIARRNSRNRSLDASLGVTLKPSWWSKMHGDSHLTAEQKLRALTTQLPDGAGAGAAGARTGLAPIAQDVELSAMSGGLRERSRSRPRSLESLASSTSSPPPPRYEVRSEVEKEGERRGILRYPMAARADSDAASARTDLTEQTLTNPQGQVVRSMLDV